MRIVAFTLFLSSTFANANSTTEEYITREYIGDEIVHAILQSLTYDTQGRLSGISQTIDNLTRNASITYDRAGKVLSITYPAGFTAHYEYNRDAQITVIKKDSETIATYGYDGAGRLSTRTLSSGVITTYAYDYENNCDRLASISVSNETALLWSESYGYNARGERTSTTRNGITERYTLDAIGQLTAVTADSPTAIGTGLQDLQDFTANSPTANLATAQPTAAAQAATQHTINSHIKNTQPSDRGSVGRIPAPISPACTYTYDQVGNRLTSTDSYGTRTYTPITKQPICPRKTQREQRETAQQPF